MQDNSPGNPLPLGRGGCQPDGVSIRETIEILTDPDGLGRDLSEVAEALEGEQICEVSEIRDAAREADFDEVSINLALRDLRPTQPTRGLQS